MKAGSRLQAPFGKAFHLSAATLATAGLLLSACSDSPFEPSVPGDHGELVFEIDASGTSVSKVQVEVSAADIEPVIVTELELAGDGTARGSMAVPEGTGRTVIARGLVIEPAENFTVQLVEVYRKAVILDVAEGTRQTISMVLATSVSGGSGGSGGGEATELETN